MIVDAAALGFEIIPEEARELAETGVMITAAANEQLGFRHPLQMPIGITFRSVSSPGPLVDDNGESGRGERRGGQTRQGGSIADGHGMLGTHGRIARAGTNAGRGSLSSAVDHWIGV